MLKKLSTQEFAKQKQEKLKRLIMQYNKMPQAYKKNKSLSEYLEENLPQNLKIQDNKHVKNKRFLQKNKINSYI